MPPRCNQTRVLVRVSCKAPANWNIKVPVDIRRETSVLVLQARNGARRKHRAPPT